MPVEPVCAPGQDAIARKADNRLKGKGIFALLHGRAFSLLSALETRRAVSGKRLKDLLVTRIARSLTSIIRTMKRRPRIAMLALLLLVPAASGGVYLGALQLLGNFHTVIPGEFYRSAQPNAREIADYARRYGIKTIINLRPKEDAAWYRDEIDTANALNIRHVDFPMSGSKLYTDEELATLVAQMRDAPKPILIHCKAGADRSGLVASLYLNRIAGVPLERAERQLSIVYGHVGVPYLSDTYAMDESWELLEAAASANHVVSATPTVLVR